MDEWVERWNALPAAEKVRVAREAGSLPPSGELPSLRKRELQDRYDELRLAVELAVRAYEEGGPPEGIFRNLKIMLQYTPVGRWDHESCIQKAAEWVERYGEPPVALNWNPAGIRSRVKGEQRDVMLARWADGEWPSLKMIQTLFVTWNAFMVEAGYPPRSGADNPSRGDADWDRLPAWGGWELVSVYRERAGLSQAKLSERSGVSAEYIGVIERGRQANPTVRILLALAHAMEIPGAALLNDRISRER